MLLVKTSILQFYLILQFFNSYKILRIKNQSKDKKTKSPKSLEKPINPQMTTKSPSPRRGVGVRLNPNLYRLIANLYNHNVISMLTDAYCCRVKGCLCFTKLCA